MARSVTVGLNGSAESLAAAHWAAREARLRHLPLRLVYAWEWLPDQQVSAASGPRLNQDWPARILGEAVTGLESRHPDLPIRTEQVESLPVPALIEAAQESELLVLGSRGLGGFRGFLAGSVSLAVVARAGRPVVLVRAHRAGDAPQDAPEPEDDRREIVAGLDLGHSCEAVAEFAFDAAALRGVPLRVVHAWRPPTVYSDPLDGGGGRTPDALEDVERQELAGAIRALREKHPDLVVHEQLVSDGAAEHLVRAASRASLLVVGRRMQRPAVATRLGAVAHSVLHHAPCPVAVVPHD